MHVLLAAEKGEHLGKEGVRLAVIERDIRRSPHDDQDPLLVDPDLREDFRARLEV